MGPEEGIGHGTDLFLPAQLLVLIRSVFFCSRLSGLVARRSHGAPVAAWPLSLLSDKQCPDRWDAGGCPQPRSFHALFAPYFSPYMVSSSIFQAGRGERGPGRDPQWLERRDRLSRVCSWELGWKRHFLWLFIYREHWE